jgi:hypothetical protein
LEGQRESFEREIVMLKALGLSKAKGQPELVCHGVTEQQVMFIV